MQTTDIIERIDQLSNETGYLHVHGDRALMKLTAERLREFEELREQAKTLIAKTKPRVENKSELIEWALTTATEYYTIVNKLSKKGA